MRKTKLQNVGDVQVEDEAEDTSTITTATLDDVMQTAQRGSDANPEGDAQEADDEAQSAAEDEALENISDSDKEKQLKRERNALMKAVGKIGEEYGAGKTSMISLAERVTEAAMSGSIGPKDAETIYDKFKEKSDAKATLDDAGVVSDDAVSTQSTAKDSKKQQVSKVRTFIRLGNEFEDDAATIVRTARNVHLKMVETQDRKTIKKGSIYSILVAVASEQLTKERKGAPMTESEIEEYLTVTVPETPPATGVKKIEDALLSARAAQRGSKDGARAPVTNDNLNLAIEHLRAALGDLAPERLEALDKKHGHSDEAVNEGAPEQGLEGGEEAEAAE